MISGAYIRCVDAGTNTEVARFDLSEDYSVETAMIFGEIYRNNSSGNSRPLARVSRVGLHLWQRTSASTCKETSRPYNGPGITIRVPMQIERGQRFKLSDVLQSGNKFSLGLTLDTGSLNIDASCFGVDAKSKLSDERYMTFFNQPRTPCGGVVMDGNRFDFDLDRLPSSINSLVITLAIDGIG